MTFIEDIRNRKSTFQKTVQIGTQYFVVHYFSKRKKLARLTIMMNFYFFAALSNNLKSEEVK